MKKDIKSSTRCEHGVLVAGSSTGIGAATAALFIKRGAQGVTITGRNEGKLKAVKEELLRNGAKADQVPAKNWKATQKG